MQKAFDIRKVFVLVGLDPHDDLPAALIADREDFFRAGLRLNPHDRGPLRGSEPGHHLLPSFVGLTPASAAPAGAVHVRSQPVVAVQCAWTARYSLAGRRLLQANADLKRSRAGDPPR
jgi:hypothetical protein